MLAIKNARIYPVDKPLIENGVILIEHGKIVDVGEHVSIPVDAEAIDAKGNSVFPGFVNAHSHLGLKESDLGFEGIDNNESTDPITPNMRAIDGFNPMDITVTEACQAGVTACGTGPGGNNVVGGTFMAVKTYGVRVDDMVIKNPVAMKAAFGEIPKETYKAKGRTPSTRMGTAALLRELLTRAVRYEKQIKYSGNDMSRLPNYDARLEAMIPVVRKEIPLMADAHRADDIFTVFRIAKEFSIDIVINHCTDGALIAERIKKEAIPVIVGPCFGHRTRFELSNKSFDTPGVLARAGVKVAIATDSGIAPINTLPVMVGMAIAAGMNFEQALKSITLNAAEIIGIQDRVGSITVGKDADLVIVKGDPFKVSSRPWKVLIDGKIVANTE